MDIKSALTVVFTIIALIFCIASASTGFVKYETDSRRTFIGILETVTYNKDNGVTSRTDAPLGCHKAQETRDANAAFIILAILALGVATIVGLIRVFAGNHAALGKYVYFGCVVCAALFSGIAFGLAFALYDGEYCSSRYKDSNGAEIGASGFLALIGCICAIVAAVLACVFSANSDFGGEPK